MAAAADRYDQRDSISTMSMLLKDHQLPVSTALAATLPAKNSTIQRYDITREPSQLENPSLERRRRSTSQVGTSSTNVNAAVETTSRLQENTFGSVSTIRDEA